MKKFDITTLPYVVSNGESTVETSSSAALNTGIEVVPKTINELTDALQQADQRHKNKIKKVIKKES